MLEGRVLDLLLLLLVLVLLLLRFFLLGHCYISSPSYHIISHPLSSIGYDPAPLSRPYHPPPPPKSSLIPRRGRSRRQLIVLLHHLGRHRRLVQDSSEDVSRV